MRLGLKSSVLATVLAIAAASPAFSQEQQTSPGANTPQTSVPQTAIPRSAPGKDTQNGAPPQDQSRQAAPNPGESTPPNQNPPAKQEQAPPQKEAQPAQQATPGVNHPAKPKPTSANSTHRKRKPKTTAQSKSTYRPKTTASPSGEPGKVVVRNGGANDDVVHLSPGGSQEQEAHNRENTDQLLATTEENLKLLGARQLSPAEQSTVDQIHSYMRQAKSAANSGDLARAHTLAFKAHLLSDDLAKH